MKRLAVILAVSLLFGAVVNVAVAWGCLLRRPFSGSIPSTRSGTAYRWPIPVPDTWPSAEFFQQQWGTGWALHTTSWEDPRALVNYIAPPAEFQIKVWHCGWPRAALRAIAVSQGVKGELAVPGKYFRTIEGIDTPSFLLSFSNWQPDFLPTRPEPVAFVINTMFYGSPIAIPLLLAGPVRRFLRLRAGLCPACKYPIGGSPVCTECGRALPKRRQPA